MKNVRIVLNSAEKISNNPDWSTDAAGKPVTTKSSLLPNKSVTKTFDVEFTRESGFSRISAFLTYSVPTEFSMEFKTLEESVTVHVEDKDADKKQYFWM